MKTIKILLGTLLIVFLSTLSYSQTKEQKVVNLSQNFKTTNTLIATKDIPLLDSLIKLSNEDQKQAYIELKTILKEFVEEDYKRLRKERIIEAKATLFWPLLFLISLILFLKFNTKRGQTICFFLGILIVISLFEIGIHLSQMLIYLRNIGELSYINLIF